MGKKTPKAPAAPDPVVTAAAQTASNKDTAVYNAALNRVNQVTPYGTLTYTQQGGGKKYDDAGYQSALNAWNSVGSFDQGAFDAKMKQQNIQPNTAYYQTQQRIAQQQAATAQKNRGAAPSIDKFLISDLPPEYTATTQLTPEAQATLEAQQRTERGQADIANDQLSRISAALSQPVDFSGLPAAPGSGDFGADRDKITDALYGQNTRLLDPQWQQQQTGFDQQMYAKGITPGSEAYRTAYDDFSRSKNDAYGSARSMAVTGGGAEQSRLFGLATTARANAIQEYLTKREMPINETSALMSGSQFQNPSFVNVPGSSAGGTDVMGAYQAQYAGQVANYQAKLAQQNATTGSIFGLAGSLGSAYLMGGFGGTGIGAGAGNAGMGGAVGGWVGSDMRLKDNVKYLGIEKGIPIYSFSYLADPERVKYRGVMAQDIEHTHPEAIVHDGEYMKVDYDKLGIEFSRIH